MCKRKFRFIRGLIFGLIIGIGFTAIANIDTNKYHYLKDHYIFIENKNGYDIYYNCYWSNPGYDPYKGETLPALINLNIPEKESKLLETKIKNHQVIDEVIITNSGLKSRNTNILYSNFLSMTFGANKICHGTIINFDSDRIEYADVYNEGNYVIIIPFVCKNITRIYPIEIYSYDNWDDRRSNKLWLDGFNEGRKTRNKVYELDTPDTFILIIIGLILLKINFPYYKN